MFKRVLRLWKLLTQEQRNKLLSLQVLVVLSDSL